MRCSRTSAGGWGRSPGAARSRAGSAGGGFGLLIPGGEASDGERRFERLRSSLHEHALGDAGVVTLSGGAAELLFANDAAALLGRADAALALAKASGRNRLVVAGRTIARDRHSA